MSWAAMGPNNGPLRGARRTGGDYAQRRRRPLRASGRGVCSAGGASRTRGGEASGRRGGGHLRPLQVFLSLLFFCFVSRRPPDSIPPHTMCALSPDGGPSPRARGLRAVPAARAAAAALSGAAVRSLLPTRWLIEDLRLAKVTQARRVLLCGCLQRHRARRSLCSTVPRRAPGSDGHWGGGRHWRQRVAVRAAAGRERLRNPGRASCAALKERFRKKWQRWTKKAAAARHGGAGADRRAAVAARGAGRPLSAAAGRRRARDGAHAPLQ